MLDIDHVQLAAPPGCEAQARHFFGELLGLAEIAKPAALQSRGGCWFRVGSRQLHIGIEQDFRPAVKAHPAFVVDDVNALCAALSAAGVTCYRDAFRLGVKRFYTNDPWGNRLEFTEGTEESA